VLPFRRGRALLGGVERPPQSAPYAARPIETDRAQDLCFLRRTRRHILTFAGTNAADTFQINLARTPTPRFNVYAAASGPSRNLSWTAVCHY
jgi:hypothetical protein